MNDAGSVVLLFERDFVVIIRYILFNFQFWVFANMALQIEPDLPPALASLKVGFIIFVISYLQTRRLMKITAASIPA